MKFEDVSDTFNLCKIGAEIVRYLRKKINKIRNNTHRLIEQKSVKQESRLHLCSEILVIKLKLLNI
jgi:hypothetical protein